MIAIIDYGMGNLRSVENALRYLKTDYCITNDAEVLRNTIVCLTGSWCLCGLYEAAASPRLGRAVERGSRKWNEAAFRNLFRHAGIV